MYPVSLSSGFWVIQISIQRSSSGLLTRPEVHFYICKKMDSSCNDQNQPFSLCQFSSWCNLRIEIQCLVNTLVNFKCFEPILFRMWFCPMSWSISNALKLSTNQPILILTCSGCDFVRWAQPRLNYWWNQTHKIKEIQVENFTTKTILFVHFL